jgi:hypothetical protein
MSHYGEAWEWGQHGVEEVRLFFQGLGHYVLDVDAIDNGGAPAIISQVRRHVTPDLQVSGGGQTWWVEVKYKSHCVKYQKTGKFRHGIDLANWNAYQQVEHETGIPGLLAIFQARPGAEAPWEPWLLVAPFADLTGGQVGQIKGVEVIFWDVDQFQRHQLESGRVPNLTRLTEVIHPWERKDSRGVAPRMPSWQQQNLWSA